MVLQMQQYHSTCTCTNINTSINSTHSIHCTCIISRSTHQSMHLRTSISHFIKTSLKKIAVLTLGSFFLPTWPHCQVRSDLMKNNHSMKSSLLCFIYIIFTGKCMCLASQNMKKWHNSNRPTQRISSCCASPGKSICTTWE